MENYIKNLIEQYNDKFTFSKNDNRYVILINCSPKNGLVIYSDIIPGYYFIYLNSSEEFYFIISYGQHKNLFSEINKLLKILSQYNINLSGNLTDFMIRGYFSDKSQPYMSEERSKVFVPMFKSIVNFLLLKERPSRNVGTFFVDINSDPQLLNKYVFKMHDAIRRTLIYFDKYNGISATYRDIINIKDRFK